MIFIDFFCLQRLKFNSLDNIVISSQEVKDYNSNWRLFPNEDALRHFASQSNNPESWIDENGQLNPLRVETHKTYIESMDAIYDQDKDVSLVSNIGEWFDGIGKEFEDYQGTKYQTMAYSLPTWGLFYVIALNAEKVDADGNTCLPYDAGYDACEVKGNWGMASGPNSYYWGGSYIGIYEGSVIKEVAYDFISSMLFDDERMIQRAENGDVYSRISIMEEITSQHQGNDVLGGFNLGAFGPS